MMLARAVLSLLLLTTGSGSVDAGALTHLRSTDPALTAAVNAGRRLSPMFRRLVDQVNASDLVIHLMYGRPPTHGIAAHLTFAAKAGGVRYIRISIDRCLAEPALVAIVGHELQHAVEIANAPWVEDQRSMAELYQHIGFRNISQAVDTFDTPDAIAAGEQVRRDLLARPSTALASGESR